ncbi:MAG: hypothetical protein KBS45_02380, partial [Clostridiales bacterium]|nr:hypothetical protein [Candidatus Coliplasma caballi]
KYTSNTIRPILPCESGFVKHILFIYSVPKSPVFTAAKRFPGAFSDPDLAGKCNRQFSFLFI